VGGRAVTFFAGGGGIRRCDYLRGGWTEGVGLPFRGEKGDRPGRPLHLLQDRKEDQSDLQAKMSITIKDLIWAAKTATEEQRADMMMELARGRAIFAARQKAAEEAARAAEPTIQDIFLEGKLDFKKVTNQDMRDLWCMLRDKPTGKKTSAGLHSKRALIVWCIENAHVGHLYPTV